MAIPRTISAFKRCLEPKMEISWERKALTTTESVISIHCPPDSQCPPNLFDVLQLELLDARQRHDVHVVGGVAVLRDEVIQHAFHRVRSRVTATGACVRRSPRAVAAAVTWRRRILGTAKRETKTSGQEYC
jgi:hypothetical protein